MSKLRKHGLCSRWASAEDAGTASGRLSNLKRLCQRAYTITEVVMAVFIVGVLTVSLYGGFTYGFSRVDVNRQSLRATQILVRRMESIRLYNWSQILDTTNYLKRTFIEYYDPLGLTNNTTGGTYRGYISSTVPTDLPLAYRTNMRTITVTVYWTNYVGRRGTLYTRSMQSRVARFGMQNYIYGSSL